MTADRTHFTPHTVERAQYSRRKGKYEEEANTVDRTHYSRRKGGAVGAAALRLVAYTHFTPHTLYTAHYRPHTLYTAHCNAYVPLVEVFCNESSCWGTL